MVGSPGSSSIENCHSTIGGSEEPLPSADPLPLPAARSPTGPGAGGVLPARAPSAGTHSHGRDGDLGDAGGRRTSASPRSAIPPRAGRRGGTSRSGSLPRCRYSARFSPSLLAAGASISVLESLELIWKRMRFSNSSVPWRSKRPVQVVDAVAPDDRVDAQRRAVAEDRRRRASTAASGLSSP